MIKCAMVICLAPLDSLNNKILVCNTGNNDLECDAHNFYKRTEMKLVVVVTPDKLLVFHLIQISSRPLIIYLLFYNYEGR